MFKLGCSKCKECSFLSSKDVIRLSDLSLGDSAIVLNVAGNDDLRIKIMEMGVVSGTELKITKKAPLGDPIDIFIRGYDLTLRKNEAELILVNKK